MKRMRPSPALVISLIALFVALGGTGYAAIVLPKNSVGTKQLKNGAVTAAKISSSALKPYLKYGRTLPSGMTEVGEWGFGTFSAGDTDAGSEGQPVFTFSVPLAHALNSNHVVYVTGSSATHCSGAGHAAPGYLCVYQQNIFAATTPDSTAIFDPGIQDGPNGAGAYGWAINLSSTLAGPWIVSGTYAVTAP